MNTDDEQRDPRPCGDGLVPGPGRPGSPIDDSSPGAHVLGVGAVLDATGAAELRREVRALLARSVAPLVVDLTAVRGAEPAAAAALRDLAYEAGDADVDLRVVRDPAAPEVVRDLLEDEALFEMYPSLDAALNGAIDAPPPGDHPGHPPARRCRGSRGAGG